MTDRRWVAWPGALAILALGCSRADLFAITEQGSGMSGGASGASGASSAGSSATESPSGCPAPALSPGDSNQTLMLNSVNRSFVLHVPRSYDGTKPVPLIVDLHGLGSSGMNELQNSPYPAVTDAEGVVIAFPDGLKGPLGTAWNLGPCCVADVDDLGFIRALVAQVQTTACIDARRVYAVGVLTGGGMVYDLASVGGYLRCRGPRSIRFIAGKRRRLRAKPTDFGDLLSGHGRSSRPVRRRAFFLGARHANHLSWCSCHLAALGRHQSLYGGCLAGRQQWLFRLLEL